MDNRDPAPDRTVEVCREFIRHRCDRSENKCRYAHPPSECHVVNGRVTCCVDHIKGRCKREKCRYYHPPSHIGEEVLRSTSSQRPRAAEPRSFRSQSPPPLSAPLSRELMIPQVPPVLGLVNPQLAEILQGYKNALDTALMATKLISVSQSQGSSTTRELPVPRMRSEPRRTDTLEVCRQFLRGSCSRKEEECRFAHPPTNVSVSPDNMVTACIDFIKGRCSHDPCRYFHPPDHLRARVYIATPGASGGGARKRTYGSSGLQMEDRDRRYGADGYGDSEPPYKHTAYEGVDHRTY